MQAMKINNEESKQQANIVTHIQQMVFLVVFNFLGKI